MFTLLFADGDTARMVAYGWKCQDKWQHISVVAEKALQETSAGHETEFTTEHYWGYATPLNMPLK